MDSTRDSSQLRTEIAELEQRLEEAKRQLRAQNVLEECVIHDGEIC